MKKNKIKTHPIQITDAQKKPIHTFSLSTLIEQFIGNVPKYNNKLFSIF